MISTASLSPRYAISHGDGATGQLLLRHPVRRSSGGLGSGVFIRRLQGFAARLRVAIGGALARRIGPVSRLQTARRNISRAFPELSETEIARIVAGMWDNPAASRRIPASTEHPRLRTWRAVETHGFEHVDRAVAAGRRMIVFSGHIANWRSPCLRHPARDLGRPDLPCR